MARPNTARRLEIPRQRTHAEAMALFRYHCAAGDLVVEDSRSRPYLRGTLSERESAELERAFDNCETAWSFAERLLARRARIDERVRNGDLGARAKL